MFHVWLKQQRAHIKPGACAIAATHSTHDTTIEIPPDHGEESPTERQCCYVAKTPTTPRSSIASGAILKERALMKLETCSGRQTTPTLS
jgi:hypothetical protein